MTETSDVLAFDARVRLGQFALDAAFTAGARITALFGPSGAGKSTVLRLIAGLQAPDDGCIQLDGRTLVDRARAINVPAHRRHLGFVFQDAQLFPHLTVRQNISFGRWFAKAGPRTVGFANVVDTLGLSPLLDRRPARLSGGERQRVALARALLAAPRMLLMDEPLSGLDVAMREEIMPIIARMPADFSVPVLYVSHAVDEVQRLAERVVLLEAGKVVRTGPTADVAPFMTSR